MYAPRGFGSSELGKFDIVSDGEALHLFALTLPNHDIVLHARSEDGLAWQALPNALATGDPGACDDDEIWSVSVTAGAGGYVMLYTALARADDGLVQRTALAHSDDLIVWKKAAANPVAEADPEWYTVGPQPGGRVSWRDPKPIRIGETYYAPLCAHERTGPFARRGCVGLLTSPDLVTWQVRPPLFAPRRGWDLECPQLFAIGETWYLTAAVSEDRSQRYWMAPAFEGPFTVPPDGGRLTPAGYYASRVCHWRGLDLLFAQATVDHDRPGFGRSSGKFVTAPLVLERRMNGRLSLHSFPGWHDYQCDASVPLTPSSRTLLHGTNAPGNTCWEIRTGGEMDILPAEETLGSTRISGELCIDAEIGGIAFGLDGEGEGYYIELCDSTAELTLKEWRSGPPRAGDRPFRYTEPQRVTLPMLANYHEPLPFSLLIVGNYIEYSLMGEVVLATHSRAPISGRFGIWTEGGSIVGKAIVAAPMRVPEHR
jgi:hypothetical protein